MDKAKVKILVVDDEQGLCAGVQEALRREGYVVDATTDPLAALKLTQERLYNLVISDIKMPGLSGLELLTQVREQSRDTLFILMTAFGTVESAVEAMKQGAYDYLPKPIDMKRLRALVQKALEFQAVVAENNELRLRLQTRTEPGLLVGESEPMRAVGAADRGGGQQRRDGADRRRERHGQGDRRALDPRAERAARAAIHLGQLRGAGGAVAGGGVVRPRQRRLHRRRRQQAGAVSTGRRRHAVPGRDRRPLAQRAGRPVARAGGRRVPDGGRLGADPRQRAGDRGDEQEAPGVRGGGQVPRGLVLSAADCAHCHAALRERAEDIPAADRALLRAVHRQAQAAAQADVG